MSLARALTSRRAKNSVDFGENGRPQRSNTLSKSPSQRPLRHKISAPVQLVHTTNMLSYNAPDIHKPTRSNSNATTTTRSDEESDARTSESTTPPTSPDGELEDTKRPEPNHLSCYFIAPGKPMPSVDAPPPTIPKRSPSHTKKSSLENVARKRSVSRVSHDSDKSLSSKGSMTFSRSSSTSTRASTTSHTSIQPTTKLAPPPLPPVAPQQAHYSHVNRTQPDWHPFGHELAQVTELAEEFGSKNRLQVIDEDEQYLKRRNLARFSAEDYLSDIQNLISSLFPELNHPNQPPAVWI